MSYELHPNQSIEENTRRVAREQIDRAIAEIDNQEVTPDETVHQVRKRCKKIRGLLRLTRPHFESLYEQENAWFRDAALKLSSARDAHVFIETFDGLTTHYHSQINSREFRPIRKKLIQRRAKVVRDEEELRERIREMRGALIAGRERISGWRSESETTDLSVEGLRKIYERGRNAMAVVLEDPTIENLHDWRRRVRYHWYHARLLGAIWRPVMKGYIRELRFLSESLGSEHDLGILEKALLAGGNGFPKRIVPLFLDLIDRRVEELRAATRPVGRKVFFEEPDQLARRFSSYWSS